MVNTIKRPGVKAIRIADLVPAPSNRFPASEPVQAGQRELHEQVEFA